MIMNHDTMQIIACLSHSLSVSVINIYIMETWSHGVMETANRLKQLYIVVAVAATVAPTD